MFDSEFVRKINTGRCFAFIGAGPSVEVGYPSWKTLAQRVRDHILKSIPTVDAASYEHFLAKEDYAAVFRQAEVDLGSRELLIATVKTAMRPSPNNVVHPIYEYLSKWPFACYLTTNYDSELKKYLAVAGHHFQEVQNRRDDLTLIRNGINHLIVKVHSDLDHPQDVVLTSLDYDRIITSSNGAHVREKLNQVFQFFDVLIVGHSMSDPDLRLITATAKHMADPLHPIYMILADATLGQIREFREQHNIHLIPYKNGDGSHRELRKMLALLDHFICSRERVSPEPPQVSEDEILAATSLLIFRRLCKAACSEPTDELFGPILISVLSRAKTSLSLDQILRDHAIADFARSQDIRDTIVQCLQNLSKEGYISEKDDVYATTARGKSECAAAIAQRQLEEALAFGQFILELRTIMPDISERESAMAGKAMRDTLIGAFRSRGLTMANIIIAEQSVGSSDLHDLFREITNQASRFDGADVRATFIQAAHRFLVEPSQPQRVYLASVSQGFFLYHMAGSDPSCRRIRRDLFADTCWFLDSSVLIPLLAVGCHNHEYAIDLFQRLNAANARLFTTERLLQEVWEHLEWAITFVKNQGIESSEFLAAAKAREGYKQNLFIDGYIRMAAEGNVGTFWDYLDEVEPDVSRQELLTIVCNRYGLQAIRISDISGFEQTDWGDVEELKAELWKARTERGTFRSEFQVEAEAEVLGIIRNIRRKKYVLPDRVDPTRSVYFVSQSRALDFVSKQKDVVTWTPEAVYRYVCSLSGGDIDPDLLQQCMLHEYYYAGVSFVDKSRYLRFFGPSINQARIAYEAEVEKYLQETEHTYSRQEFDEGFDRTPDLEKPFFVAQMGWQIARIAEQRAQDEIQRAQLRTAVAVDEAKSATAIAKVAVAQREVALKSQITAEQEVRRLRNLRDPKHAKKREKQAKKRAKRKKKRK